MFVVYQSENPYLLILHFLSSKAGYTYHPKIGNLKPIEHHLLASYDYDVPRSDNLSSESIDFLLHRRYFNVYHSLINPPRSNSAAIDILLIQVLDFIYVFDLLRLDSSIRSWWRVS
jgi:hypothetical protein